MLTCEDFINMIIPGFGTPQESSFTQEVSNLKLRDHLHILSSLAVHCMAHPYYHSYWCADSGSHCGICLWYSYYLFERERSMLCKET